LLVDLIAQLVAGALKGNKETKQSNAVFGSGAKSVSFAARATEHASVFVRMQRAGDRPELVLSRFSPLCSAVFCALKP
jgi:hypothetical protein